MRALVSLRIDSWQFGAQRVAVALRLVLEPVTDAGPLATESQSTDLSTNQATGPSAATEAAGTGRSVMILLRLLGCCDI